MFEDLQSGGARRRRRTTGERMALAAVLAGAGLATVLLAYIAFNKHPFGWSAVPQELRALPRNASRVEIQRALDAAQRHDFANLIIFGIVEPILAFLVKRIRAGSQAAAAALGLTAVGALTGHSVHSVIPGIAGALAGAYALYAIRVADQWQRCIVLRFGRYHSLRGPGVFHIIPLVDKVAAVVDERVRTTAIHAKAALTADAVPVYVDAVIFWVVHDTGKAVLEVQDFDEAIGLAAQAALLEAIGRHDLGETIAERGPLARDLQSILERRMRAWGITVQSVEIREVRLPSALQDAMSRQAQAERERQARVIFGNTEVDLAAKFDEASAAYKDDPVALHLRAMNMLYEAIKEKGTMVVVPQSGLRRKRRVNR